MSRYRILITEKFGEEGLRLLRQEQELAVDFLPNMAPDTLMDSIEGYHALIVRSKTKVHRPLIERGRQLKVIGRAGVGLDNIDLTAAAEKGIRIINSKGESSISVAEHAIALLLALARHIPQAHQSIVNGEWRKDLFLGTEVYDKTLGIIGLGSIGAEVLTRALALGMRPLAYDPYWSGAADNALHQFVTGLDELLTQSDFITVHVPKTDETVGLLSFREIARCKQGVCLINTSRGGIIDEQALAHYLAAGHLGGVALDVFENEPKINHGLLSFPNVIATPHIAGSTSDAQRKISVSLAQQLLHAFYQLGVVAQQAQASSHTEFPSLEL